LAEGLKKKRGKQTANQAVQKQKGRGSFTKKKENSLLHGFKTVRWTNTFKKEKKTCEKKKKKN